MVRMVLHMDLETSLVRPHRRKSLSALVFYVLGQIPDAGRSLKFIHWLDEWSGRLIGRLFPEGMTMHEKYWSQRFISLSSIFMDRAEASTHRKYQA
jgi:hypothetical protein